MRTLLRAGFVALIVLGLASQAIRAGRGEDDGPSRPGRWPTGWRGSA